jgi:hypothetical protein
MLNFFHKILGGGEERGGGRVRGGKGRCLIGKGENSGWGGVDSCVQGEQTWTDKSCKQTISCTMQFLAHERTISFKFLGIILSSIYNVYITNHFQTTFVPTTSKNFGLWRNQGG